MKDEKKQLDRVVLNKKTRELSAQILLNFIENQEDNKPKIVRADQQALQNAGATTSQNQTLSK